MVPPTSAARVKLPLMPPACTALQSYFCAPHRIRITRERVWHSCGRHGGLGRGQEQREGGQEHVGSNGVVEREAEEEGGEEAECEREEGDEVGVKKGCGCPEEVRVEDDIVGGEVLDSLLDNTQQAGGRQGRGAEMSREKTPS